MLFVDKISLSSLLRICRLNRSIETIWSVEPLTISSKRWLFVLHKLGVIRADVRQIEHHIGHVKNEAGDIDLINLRESSRMICLKIKEGEFSENSLISFMEPIWASRKVLLYFEKKIESDISVECLRIGLVEWIHRTQSSKEDAPCILAIERMQWFAYLESYAQAQGVQLVAYNNLWDLGVLCNVTLKGIWFARKLFVVLMRGIKNQLQRIVTSIYIRQKPEKSANINKLHQPSIIAIRYWHRNLSLDPTERSEFFWLNKTGVPCDEVLLYDYVSEKPIDNDLLEELSRRGIKLMGKSPGIPSWTPSWQLLKVLVFTLTKLLAAYFKHLTNKKKVSFYQLYNLVTLAVDYSFWYDFFYVNRIRVNVGTLNTSVSQVLALDALGCISASYQYSASNVLVATTLLSAGENIQFVFSPIFERLWRTVDPSIDTYVHTGYIYDGAIKAVQGLDRVARIKDSFKEKGVRFTICFFDENSADRWDIFHWHEDAAADYEYLLNWLLEDPTLGLIFKPKVSTNLFERIKNVSELIERTDRTGRCKFLMSNTLVGNIYPAEAAMMADLCIGWITGSTACLEARLAGVPAILIDPVGFRSHPFHTWGRGRVVFDDWESLRGAVEQYRTAPEAYPEFGDWSPGLDDLDPFQDGRASLRMGLFISWVYEALKQGASQHIALVTAAKKYAEQWGSTHITH